MNPDRCPIKNCTYSKRLILCPVHWDMVDPALKLTIYDLGNDLEHGELDEKTFEETTAKYLETEAEIVSRINARVGAA